MSVVVSDGDECLEASALSGAGLFLYGHNLQHLILQSRTQEEVDDFKFLKEKRDT